MSTTIDIHGGTPLVVAVVATDSHPGRAEMRGISDAARERGWELETIDSAIIGAGYGKLRPLLSRADGIVARLYDTISDGTLGSIGVPLVGLDIDRSAPVGRQKEFAERTKSLWVKVVCDHRSVAETAAKELLAMDLRAYAFVPMLRRFPWTGGRGQAFIDAIKAAGRDVRLYEPVTAWGWTEERENLARWLASLPQPFGIFAGNDLLAKFSLDACRTAGIPVPQGAAIIGADDDEMFCLSASPRISSVRIDFEGAGRLAVEAVAAMLGRRKPARTPRLWFGATGVSRRDSTRSVDGGAPDLRMAAAAEFIATHVADPYVGARDVAAAMGLGRRQADRVFAKSGKTVRQSIEDARLAAAKRQLETTRDTVAAIASRCGFSSANYFIRIFRMRFGVPPGIFRSRAASSR